MQPVATRLSALSNVTRISSSFGFDGEVDDEVKNDTGAGIGADVAAAKAARIMLSSSPF